LRSFIAASGAIVAAAMLSLASLPQDRGAELRSRFEQETNPVQKAKLLPSLGEAEFELIRKDAEADRLPDALALLRQYRDQAESCAKGLDDTKVDAEKHPAGFKQLQISVQESLRRVDALLVNMTGDEQAPFRDVRNDLEELNQHLIERLFPRRAPEAQKHATSG